MLAIIANGNVKPVDWMDLYDFYDKIFFSHLINSITSVIIAHLRSESRVLMYVLKNPLNKSIHLPKSLSSYVLPLRRMREDMYYIYVYCV